MEEIRHVLEIKSEGKTPAETVVIARMEIEPDRIKAVCAAGLGLAPPRNRKAKAARNPNTEQLSGVNPPPSKAGKNA